MKGPYFVAIALVFVTTPFGGLIGNRAGAFTGAEARTGSLVEEVRAPQGVGPTASWPHGPVDCRPVDAGFGPGQTFDPSNGFYAALRAALFYLQNNPGIDGIGTLAVEAGEYRVDVENSEQGWIDLQGAAIEICGRDGIVQFKAPAGDAWRFNLHGVGDLSFKNLDMDGFWFHTAFADDLEILNTRIAETSSECVFLNAGADINGHKNDVDPAAYFTVLISHSLIEGCRNRGANRNVGHAMYLVRRGCAFVLRESTLRSEGSLEVWRTLCRFNLIENNYLSNSETFPAHNNHTIGVLQVYSCGLHVIRNNIIEAANGAPAIVSSSRRGIAACDMPNQFERDDSGMAGDTAMPGGEILVQDREFWKTVHAGGVPQATDDVASLLANPRLFPLIIENNILRGTGGRRAIMHYTTYPHDKKGQGNNNDNEYLKVPYDSETDEPADGWTERSFAVLLGNRFEDFELQHISLRPAAVDPSTRPDVMDFLARELDRGGTPKAFTIHKRPADWMPDDWKRVCPYFRNRSDWPDETGRPGFPICPSD